MKKLFLFSIASLLYVCAKLPDEAIYFIKKGNHHAEPRKLTETGSVMSFRFYVHHSWHHTEVNSGWNKLIGLNPGIDPKQNSARIVWRCVNNRIIAGALFHQNGKATWMEMQELDYGRWYYGSIRYHAGAYYICVDGAMQSLAGYTHTRNRHWLCHPYFGGKDTAPHDMKFHFDFL